MASERSKPTHGVLYNVNNVVCGLAAIPCQVKDVLSLMSSPLLSQSVFNYILHFELQIRKKGEHFVALMALLLHSRINPTRDYINSFLKNFPLL